MSDYDPYVQRHVERGEQLLIAEAKRKGWSDESIWHYRVGYWLGWQASGRFTLDTPADLLRYDKSAF